MSEKKPGILDPWRIVEPLKAPPPKVPTPNRKIDLHEIDFDADLKAAGTCSFRSLHGTVTISSRKIETQNDGLAHLVDCLFSILDWNDGRALFDAAKIGLERGPREWQRPGHSRLVSTLQTAADYKPRSVIWFHDQSYDEGMRQLVRLLGNVRKRTNPYEAGALKRWGITPAIK